MSESAKTETNAVRTTEEQQLWDNVVLNLMQRNTKAEEATKEANAIVEARRKG
jgi:L-rhamnose mutarotase